VLGLLPQVSGVGQALRLIAIWALVLLSSAAVGPMIARLARGEAGRAE
jgi:multicomponent Na+:H+ antiporter subunit G